MTERATLLRNAEQETEPYARLVEDLLVLANGDLDALPAHLHPIAPDNLCLEVYDAFFPLAQQRQHPLSLTLPEDSVPSIEADPDRVKQLLAILLNNAFDHTPRAPRGTVLDILWGKNHPGRARPRPRHTGCRKSSGL